MKAIPLLISLTCVVLLQGCSLLEKNQNVHWGNGTCPAPAKSDIEKGHLLIQDGKTLKCQLKPYVSNMDCQGITDKTGADGLVCQNGLGQSILFIFDEKGVLQKHGDI
ncbi:hypothetical protein BFG07_06545 [Kosakonia cowanii]|uniref:hypothetical protein n=1 Tax=Kosakonia cowanii TaxID=208223 RepID=UPI000B96460A|nr:hypothetical protein [Kosakonia cowanii]AST68359.1 hypothetical protein BFG07_06545 [Kosakonia cowanii]